MPELFAKSRMMGTFKGFAERGFEFAAEIVAPYDSSMIDKPQLGQFLLIELGSTDEASLGRITKFIPTGMLASAEGEDYINTMQSRDQDVPEDLKQQKLKYRVQIKLLGAVKVEENKIVFVPSQRRLPHLGAKVASPSEEVLNELCALSGGETLLGNYVLGEFIFNGNKGDDISNLFRQIEPELKVRFNINNLVSRRSVVFARAGYGKSNLIKYLISELYKEDGKHSKTEKGQSVGTLIFDRDGEYFWPDHKNRPGLCDVPEIQDRILVFTKKKRDKCKAYYESFKAGDVRLDLRTLNARDVINITISAERQNQQNIIKLKTIGTDNWVELIDLVHTQGYEISDSDLGRLMGYNQKQITSNLAEIGAARSNINTVVRTLHDPDSVLINQTIEALRNGKIVVIDFSLLSSSTGYNIAGLLMRKIFSYNQENFTGGESPIPVITIIEEAQSVLGRNLDESSPFVEWAKEGRKYDLGAILVTQQPGALAPEIMSQADNWFSFHLLSEGDAGTLGKYNSHFSHDILAHIIGEPIIGNCYMWSAPLQPFVLPVRVMDFEKLFKQHVNKQDAPYEKAAAAEVKQVAMERSKAIVEKVQELLLRDYEQKLLGFIPIEDGQHEDYYGFKDGKLYHLLHEAKGTVEEIRTENQLKKPLLDFIFGTDELTKIKYNSLDYWIGHKSVWEKLFKNI